ncbi:hypothetical protein [Nostoc sp. NMS4]|uniref:hypothetical protein n=1 Tax=Nostoc sp. NMS4 TaxID=2815390 RepID=UPI0025E5AC49|nr:hypothetical protein [Nostoc sp. NMS4]MBN3922307.1 hypothetical protein [Nostoc sp. NMS4]
MQKWRSGDAIARYTLSAQVCMPTALLISPNKHQKPDLHDRVFEWKQWGYIPRRLVIEVQYNIDALICTTTQLLPIPEN